MSIQTFYDDGTIETTWEPIEVVQPRVLSQIDQTRDTRIENGFVFVHDGEHYPVQTRPSDRENISILGLTASSAVAAGAQIGDLNWLDPQNGFVFIMADNRVVPMDAHMMASMFRQAMAFKSSTTFYARALKDAVLACETDEQISALDLSGGWPGEV